MINCWSPSTLFHFRAIWLIAICVWLAVASFPVLAAPVDTPFSAMQGSWSGTGTIILSNGAKERIRCRANDRLSSSNMELRLELNCDSDSYNFNLQSQIIYRDGTLSGNWYESTRATGGSVSGRIVGNQVQVRAEGQTFAAILSLTTRGDRQSISIQSPGSEMSDVAITLIRKSR